MKQIMKKFMGRFAAAVFAVCLVFHATGGGVVVMQTAEEAGREAGAESADKAESSPDEAFSPQNDYYGYVNKEYLDSLEVSYADREGVGGMVDQMNAVDEELYRMITGIAASSDVYAPGSSKQLVRDAYNQIYAYLMNGGGSGGESLREVSAMIRAADDTEDLKKVVRALIEKYGITAYFDAEVEQNYYDGSSYALTLLQKREFAGFLMEELCTEDSDRQSLRVFVLNILVEDGEEPARAKEKADELVCFVTGVACNTDYSLKKLANPYLALDFSTDAETDALLKNVTSKDLSRMYVMENPYGGWMIEDERQAAYMAEQFSGDNLEVLKNWLLCEVAYEWRYYLKGDHAFLETYTDSLSGAVDVLAAQAVRELLDAQVSELYAEYYYTGETDRQVRQMYEDISASYEELIKGADWLTKATRERLLRKLHNMTFICGVGKAGETNPRDAALIGSDAFDTMCRIRVWKAEKARERIGTKIDRETSDMASFVVNARYSLNNSFIVCAGIMKEPYFDPDADYAENLGGLGIVIAHEMGHAFDSVCMDYDENGVYDPDGICEEDREKLAERLRRMEEYYSSFAVMDIYYVDGVMTSGENYADKGAMECMMNLVKKPDDRKKVFRAFARVFGMLMEDNYAVSLLDEDEHSPNEVRVNAVLSSTDEFYEAYDVQPGDGMYVAPEERVSRYR